MSGSFDIDSAVTGGGLGDMAKNLSGKWWFGLLSAFVAVVALLIGLYLLMGKKEGFGTVDVHNLESMNPGLTTSVIIDPETGLPTKKWKACVGGFCSPSDCNKPDVYNMNAGIARTQALAQGTLFKDNALTGAHEGYLERMVHGQPVTLETYSAGQSALSQPAGSNLVVGSGHGHYA